ncbi:isoprenylcysteine carboxyl methyltransferase [Diplocarpon rosae]|nr:isoprenylcysteine carboxyl methyltransferase [Diplocarpon rosae]
METPDVSSVLLSFTTLVVIYLTLQCYTPPNPAPVCDTEDRIFPFAGDFFLLIRRLTFAVLGLYHAILMLYPNSPPTVLCPNPSNLNPSLFTWTTHSMICFGIVFIAAPIRLLAFAQLGKNFTFKLAKPQQLVTGGLYAYVQHPSYTTLAIVALSNWRMFERADGVIGCWMSAELVQSVWWDVAGCGLVAVAFWILSLRVMDEEKMLKSTFGKDWEIWHQKTKRFVPGAF